jgi:hypothetical protein
VIGRYCPDQWEDTTGKKRPFCHPDYKYIVSGSPFLFYWVTDKIEIIKHSLIPSIGSGYNWLMGYGLRIKADKNEKSWASAGNNHWVHP